MASKSLGTLTLDLIARTAGFVQGMNEAERTSRRWRQQVAEDIKVVSEVAVVGMAAAGVAIGAMTAQTVEAADELTRLASISMSTTQELQRQAQGAELLGVDLDTLANQYKDFNEKTGEFLQFRSGGMVGFFEEIAPKIGLTAEAFKDLSGPQALQLYYDSLEKAGLSQKEMSIYLEDMASDTTALIPLLANGGAGFKLMGDMAERAGAIMSEETVEAANRASATMLVLKTNAEGLQNKFMDGLLPALEDMAAGMDSSASFSAVAADAGQTFGNVLRGIASVAIGAYAAFDLLGRAIAAVGARFADAELDWTDALIPMKGFVKLVRSELDDVQGVAEQADADLEATVLRYGELINKLWEPAQTNGNSIVDQIAELQAKARNAQGALEGMADAATPSPEQLKRLKQLKEQLADLEANVTSGSGENLLPVLDKIREIKAEIADIESMKLVPDTIDYSISAYDKFREQWDDLVKVQNDYKRQMQEIAATELSAIERKKLMARADEDRLQALKDLRSAEIEKLGARLQGGQDTGSVNMDFINRSGEFAPERGRSSQAFEEAARRFADSIDSGMLSPEGAARQLSMLDSMAGKLGALGEGFDAEGMRTAVQNLASQTRDMFASGDGGKPLTAEEMERVFKEAQEKAAAMEQEQRDSWASIKHLDEVMSNAFGEDKSPQGKITIAVKKDGGGGTTEGVVSGDSDFLASLLSTLENVRATA